MNLNSNNRAFIIAAPSSGSGKTLITLALLRAFVNLGQNVCAAKAGPDYIDPAFHFAACGKSSINLDPWAMTKQKLKALAGNQNGELLIVEAMMGLFDGAADGSGSAADLAVTLGAPVILVVDVAKQSHSVAALVQGFANHRAGVNLAGVILNKVGSKRHEVILRTALNSIGMPVLGVVYRDENLVLPERHLGLVQASEQKDIDGFINRAANIISETCDLAAIKACATPLEKFTPSHKLSPLGQRIAIAKDNAFSFIYPHLLSDWQDGGAELSFFSPLANEGPHKDADAIYLPGGYPELHAGTIAIADNFRAGMKNAAAKNKLIYGECGGYMVLGEGIEDKNRTFHKMLGLLKLQTSFAKRKLHLGYRKLDVIDAPLFGANFAAHEFHYTSAVKEEGQPLFVARDALDTKLGNVGLRNGHVMGSYMHIIDEVL